MVQKKIMIEIEPQAHNQIYSALEKFGNYEIGGILIGSQKGKNHFSISEATVADDVKKFSIAGFIREPFKSMKALLRSFDRKKHNYIGEWHSHPQFSLYPSGADIKTMQGILDDPGYGVSFALLIITKINDGRADMEGFLFHKKIERFAQASISCSQNSSAQTQKNQINISV